MIKTEPWTGGTEEEYETQHFGFGAQRLKVAVRQMVEEKIQTGVKAMESCLQEALSLNDTDKATLTYSCQKLIRLYCGRAGPSLGVIDEEIERLLKVPSNVLLPGDEVQAIQVTNEEHEKLKAEVNELRKRVERGALMEVLLCAEEEELSSIDKVCDTAKKDMELLDLLHGNIMTRDEVKTIQDETEDMCIRAPFLSQGKDNMWYMCSDV